MFHSSLIPLALFIIVIYCQSDFANEFTGCEMEKVTGFELGGFLYRIMLGSFIADVNK